MLEIPNDQGEIVRFCTATEAPQFCGPDVTRDMVYEWRKRRLINGYRVGREVYFRVDELKEVEGVTRRSGKSHRGRRRPG